MMDIPCPLFVGNWKMHKDAAATASFFEAFRQLIGSPARCDVVICPTFLGLETAVRATRGTGIRIGAQNLHWAKEGAYTGEISGAMIRASGCSHVIVGHSERRKYFGETNESVSKKTVTALGAGLTPIVCIGEFERKNAREVIAEQFSGSMGMLTPGQFDKIVIAYDRSGLSALAKPPRPRLPPPFTASFAVKRKAVSERRLRTTCASYTAAA